MTVYKTTEDFYNRCNELFYVDYNFNLRRKVTVAPNAVKGSIAGGLDGSSGYLRVKVDRKSYLVHRVIYLMHYGVLPEYIDHIDGNILNNSIDNLRFATKQNNRWNSKGNRDTQTGVKGVYRDRDRFKALITVDGIRYYLGMFSSIEEAKKIVDEKYTQLQKEFSLQISRNNEKVTNTNYAK